LLSKVGKIQADCFVVARGTELCLVLSAETEAAVQSELERMLVMEDAVLESRSAGLSCLALHGPRARELAQGLAGQGGVTVADLDRTGLGGALLLVPREAAPQVSQSLVAAGALAASPEDWERLRVERRIGAFGVDYGPADNPHEAALERVAVSWSKGCYLGQEVVFMQDARGKLKRRLALLELDGARPTPGTPVTTDAGEALGDVTSSTESAILGRPLALARVKAPHYEPGVRLRVGGATAVVRAEPV
jgi:folate-binding protein YgfZ